MFSIHGLLLKPPEPPYFLGALPFMWIPLLLSFSTKATDSGGRRLGPGPSSTLRLPPHICNPSWDLLDPCQGSLQPILFSLVPVIDLAHSPFLLIVKTLLDRLGLPPGQTPPGSPLDWLCSAGAELTSWAPSQLFPQLIPSSLPSCADGVPLSSGSSSPGASCVQDCRPH